MPLYFNGLVIIFIQISINWLLEKWKKVLEDCDNAQAIKYLALGPKQQS